MAEAKISKSTKCARPGCGRPAIEHAGWRGHCTTPGVNCDQFVAPTKTTVLDKFPLPKVGSVWIYSEDDGKSAFANERGRKVKLVTTVTNGDKYVVYSEVIHGDHEVDVKVCSLKTWREAVLGQGKQIYRLIEKAKE